MPFYVPANLRCPIPPKPDPLHNSHLLFQSPQAGELGSISVLRKAAAAAAEPATEPATAGPATQPAATRPAAAEEPAEWTSASL